jgi:hypothetical protein
MQDTKKKEHIDGYGMCKQRSARRLVGEKGTRIPGNVQFLFTQVV